MPRLQKKLKKLRYKLNITLCKDGNSRHKDTMLTSNTDPGREAQIRFFDADFKQIVRGDYVICAATQRKIPIDMLRYWSVDLQEAYFDAAAASHRRAEIAAEGT